MTRRSRALGSRNLGSRDLAGGFVLVGTFLVLLLAGQGFLLRQGVFPEALAYRSGVAVIDTCRPALRWAGMVHTCRATVTWQPADQWKPGLPLNRATSMAVISDQAISGEVTVASHRQPTLTRTGSADEMVIATTTKTMNGSGWWWVPVVLAQFALPVLATVAFHKISRRITRARDPRTG